MSETPDIRTRFRLDGLKQAATQLRSFARRASDSFAIAREQSRDAFEPARKSAEQLRRSVRRLGSTLRTAGVGGFRALNRIGVTAFRGAAAVAVRAAGAMRLALGGIAIGGAAAGAAIERTVSSSAEFVELQSRFARAGGTSVEAFSRLSYAARQFGVANDEVLGALSTLSDKIAEAARGEGAAEFFEKMGVAVQDADGQFRDSIAVLLDLIDASKQLNTTQRAGLFNELLGGDAEKLASVLALTSDEIRALGDEGERLGVALGEERVKEARLYSKELRRMQAAFRGLTLEVGRRLYPAFARVTGQVAEFVAENRARIADLAEQTWGKLLRVVEDFILVARGLERDVRNRWILEWRDRLSFLGDAFQWVRVLAAEFFAVMRGGNSERFPWLVSLRDRAVAAAEQTRALVRDIELILSGKNAESYPWLDELVDRVRQGYEWSSAFAEALSTVLSGDDAPADFAWMNAVRDYVNELSAAFATAWRWFRRVYDFLSRELREAFGLDLGSTLLFIGLLRLSGLLGLITAPLNGIIGAFRLLAGIFRSKAGASILSALATIGGRASSGVAATARSVAAALGSAPILARGAGLAAAAGPWGLTIGAGVAAGFGLHKALKALGWDKELRRFVDDVLGYADERDRLLARLREQSSDVIPKYLDPRFTSGIPELGAPSIVSSSEVARPAASGRPIILNLAGSEYPMTADEDVAARLQRDLRRRSAASQGAMPRWRGY